MTSFTTIVDLTHPIEPGMAVLHRGLTPAVQDYRTIKDHGRSVQKVSFGNHVGTHIDAPNHFVPNGADVSRLDLTAMVGPCLKIDFTDKKPGSIISAEDLRKRFPHDAGAERLLLATGWDSRFGSESFFHNFPHLDLEATSFLVDQGLQLLGMDTPSPGPLNEMGEKIHRMFLDTETVILEALKNLTSLPEKDFFIAALPLPFTGCSGFPCRAVALLQE